MMDDHLGCGWHLAFTPTYSKYWKKIGTGVSDPVLSSCRVRDVESDILFCFLCFSAQQFKHDGKVLVQFLGIRIDRLVTTGVRCLLVCVFMSTHPVLLMLRVQRAVMSLWQDKRCSTLVDNASSVNRLR